MNTVDIKTKISEITYAEDATFSVVQSRAAHPDAIFAEDDSLEVVDVLDAFERFEDGFRRGE